MPKSIKNTLNVRSTMRKIQFLVVTTLLVLGFQNCTETQTKPSTAENYAGTDTHNQAQNPDTLNSNPSYDTDSANGLTDIEKIEVQFSKNISREDLVSQKSIADSMILTVLLDLKSKNIEIYDESGQKVNKKERCLKTQEHNELISILKTAQLCESLQEQKIDSSTQDSVQTNDSSPSATEKICTAVYKAPYASLIKSSGDDIRLGEAFNGCEIKQDLCGDHSSMLKGFLQHIQSTLDQERPCE